MTWESVPLGEIAALNPRDRPISRKTTFLGMADLGEDGRTTQGTAIEPGELKPGYTPFRNDDLLVAKITPCFENGKIGQASIATDSGWGSTEFHVVRPDDALVDRRYLLHFLRSPRVRATGEMRMTGSAGQKRVPIEFLRKLTVPLPPLPEQRRIAAILDEADALRAKSRRMQARMDGLRVSVFRQQFTDQQTTDLTVADVLADIPNAIRTGPFGSDLLHSEFVDEGVPVLGIDNVVQNSFVWARSRFITQEKYASLQRYTVHPGDVLITIMGTVGRCAIAPADIGTAINTKHLCCITLDRSRCLPEYLHAYFLYHPTAQQYLRKTSKGAIMAGLNMGIIKRLPLVLPPLSQQEEYVVALREISEMDDVLRGRDFDALFASLQHHAFKGGCEV